MDLQVKRSAALAAAKAIEDTAAADGRGFTDDERSAHAQHLAEARALATDIAQRVEAEAERNRILPELQGAVAALDGSPSAAGTHMPTAPGSIEMSQRDPGLYRPGETPHAFFGDLLSVQTRNDLDGSARERLASTTAFERTQPRNILTNTDGTGQEFLPPGYLQDLFVERAVGQSVLAGLVNILPLPAGGRSVTIPRMTGDASVDEHTEDQTGSETTPTTDDATASVYHLVGLVKASMFLRDRANPAIDAIIMRHFAKLQAMKIDTRIANGSGTGQAKGVLNVSSINTATLSSDGDLSAAYPKIADVTSQIEDGNYTSPTAIVICARRWGAWAAELDSTGRPLLSPSALGAMNPTAGAIGNPKPAAAGFTGYSAQGIPIYKAAAIPTTLGGSTNQDAILVCDWEEFFLFLSGVMFDASEHAEFGKVNVVFRSRQYYAFLADHKPEAIGKITGAGLVAPSF
jgi:HK97 family phage major capsid protein